MSDLTARLESMLAAGQDNLLLRFSLGKAKLEADLPVEACDHLQAALDFDPKFSNAWKLLGKAQLALDQPHAARRTWETAAQVAAERGDAQVAKEVAIFLKRLDKLSGPS